MNEERKHKKLYNLLYSLRITHGVYLTTDLTASIDKLGVVLSYHANTTVVHPKHKKIVNCCNKLLEFVETNGIEQEIYGVVLEEVNQLFIHPIEKYRIMRRNSPKFDNKDRKVGSGGCNINKIRVPSLKHKNRWKRFVKLFPEYLEMYNQYFNKNK